MGQRASEKSRSRRKPLAHEEGPVLDGLEEPRPPSMLRRGSEQAGLLAFACYPFIEDATHRHEDLSFYVPLL
jgi:hypothetical protein